MTMGKSLKIFSIEDYSETHKIIYIFGIKIKFPKAEYIKKQKSNPFEKYKNDNVDITTIPPATGQIRDIQLANLELLKELDYVCKKNNLHYWLEYGTLLGAYRHKGFIPWDDDIDVGIIRDEYEKLFESFDKTKRKSDIELNICNDRNNHTILKVCHKKCKHLFVDIFPYEYAPDLEISEQVRITQKLKNYNRENFVHIKSFNELENKVKEVTSTYYAGKGSMLAFGMEYGHTPKNWFFPENIMFPLKELEFEGYKFPVFNKYEKYLELIYGNYMAYPKKFGMGHAMYLNLTDEDKRIISELIK